MKAFKIFGLATALSMTTALAHADSQSALPLSIEQGNCPTFVKIGIKGESFATGLRYTIDIKNYLDFGSSLKINAKNSTVVFDAPVRSEFYNCIASAAFGIWQGTFVRIDFQNGYASVTLYNQSPSLQINNLSTYNNQAIFAVSERL